MLRQRTLRALSLRERSVALLVEVVDELQRGVVEGTLLGRQRLDVPAHQRPKDRLQRPREKTFQAWAVLEGSLRRHRPKSLRLRADGDAAAAHAGAVRRLPSAAHLLLETRDERGDIHVFRR